MAKQSTKYHIRQYRKNGHWTTHGLDTGFYQQGLNGYRPNARNRRSAIKALNLIRKAWPKIRFELIKRTIIIEAINA